MTEAFKVSQADRDALIVLFELPDDVGQAVRAGTLDDHPRTSRSLNILASHRHESQLLLLKFLEAIRKEAAMANGTIALNRDGGGNGRVKVATCMHHVERLANEALATICGEGS